MMFLAMVAATSIMRRTDWSVHFWLRPKAALWLCGSQLSERHSQSRLIHETLHFEHDAAAGARGEAHVQLRRTDSSRFTVATGFAEAMFAVAAGLNDDTAGFERVRVDQGQRRFIGGHLFDQGGHVVGQAGATPVRIEVAAPG